MRWIFIFLILAAFTGAVLLLGNRVPGQPAHIIQSPEARRYTIVYRDGVFSPTNLRIPLGDSVIFENASSQTIALPAFRSGDIAAGASFTYIFSAAGTYVYENQYHPEQQGTITVQP